MIHHWEQLRRDAHRHLDDLLRDAERARRGRESGPAAAKNPRALRSTGAFPVPRTAHGQQP